MRTKALLALGTAVVSLLPSPWIGTARAACADIVVTNPGDMGSGSLRQALVDICPDGTVRFDPSLKGMTVLLSGGPLGVDKSVTLVGPGARDLALSAGKQSRVRLIQANANVRISGLTIRDGATAAGAAESFFQQPSRPAGNGEDGGGILDRGTLASAP